ncbi:MAG TPA: phage holin family protein [Rhizomicrobium sp.]|jgi:uncharacterized membrane protein YqjE|nr:phage holin family protein [Rhizomicrobium sp.]
MNVERTITTVLSDLMSEFIALFRNELRLARTEISEKISLLGSSLAFVGIGAVLLIAALVIFLEAAVAGLITAGFSLAVSSLIVAGVTLIVGAIVLWTGIGRMKAKNLAPKKTAHQLQRDADMARYQVKAS